MVLVSERNKSVDANEVSLTRESIPSVISIPQAQLLANNTTSLLLSQLIEKTENFIAVCTSPFFSK
jgi:hypothetical protein